MGVPSPRGRLVLGGGLLGGVPGGDPPDGYCFGRYASYWNEFLFIDLCQKNFTLCMWNHVMEFVSTKMTTKIFSSIFSFPTEICMQIFKYSKDYDNKTMFMFVNTCGESCMHLKKSTSYYRSMFA